MSIGSTSIVPSHPGWPNNRSDVGPGALPPGQSVLRSHHIQQICQNAADSGDHITAILAQLLARQAQVNCQYTQYSVTLKPNVTSTPANELLVVEQQILPQNLTRRSLVVACPYTVLYNSGSNYQLLGLSLQVGPNTAHTRTGNAAANILSKVLPFAYANASPAFFYLDPAPTDPITAVAAYGTVAGGNIGPISFMVMEGYS